ncbi:hypothetical protein DENSPDRAFT_664193 [Dentipellis sp. KUC8613]|nr:hypothetical protein DENSPDRAFT_664193 [Dentipellis sp. KUC8613]
MPSTSKSSATSNAPDNAPSKTPSVRERSLTPRGEARPSALQSAEPTVPTSGAVGVAPSSGPQRTNKARKDARSRAKTGQGLKRPAPYGKTEAYPAIGEERYNTGQFAWEFSFPGCVEEIRDTEADISNHFAQEYPLKGGGKYACALLVKEKTGSQEVRRCAISYKHARGLGRHVLSFHMGLGRRACSVCGKIIVRGVNTRGLNSSAMARHMDTCRGVRRGEETVPLDGPIHSSVL